MNDQLVERIVSKIRGMCIEGFHEDVARAALREVLKDPKMVVLTNDGGAKVVPVFDAGSATVGPDGRCDGCHVADVLARPGVRAVTEGK